jgi:Domain of unknown function (DUF4282)
MVIRHGYAKLNPPGSAPHPATSKRAPDVLLAPKNVQRHQPLKRPVRLTRRGRKCSLRGAICGADRATPRAPCGWEEGRMFDLRDLFQWERFITPSIIKVFYWLAVIIMVLSGFSGMLSGLALMTVQPIGGLFLILVSVVGTLAGVILIRILSEFVLITFRINEHLGAIRNRGQM